MKDFNDHPVDSVQWVEIDKIKANDYNPNTVAPPEMELLQLSIESDGYTQPIVAWAVENDEYEVVDGFHRYLVGKKIGMTHLPLVVINKKREKRSDRIASTIRHNRARGKHKIDSMSDIIIELKNRNWTNKRISKELGMDEDEILRLCQITGLESLFKDEDFSKSWNIEDSEIEDKDFTSFTDEISDEEKEENEFRTVNTSDPERIFHTYKKWECYKAGFYNTTKEGMKEDECEQAYADFLSNTPKFEQYLKLVITEWKHSCEHYLTNVSMNRIAWLGQASMCYATGIPNKYCGGFHLLTDEQQLEANKTALIYLNKWFKDNGRKEITLEDAMTTKQVNIY